MKPLILVAKGVRPLRNGRINAKSYPFWDWLIKLLQVDYEVQEIMEMPLDQLNTLVKSALTVVCVDSFIQHFCWSIGKKVVVLWGSGHPNIYGHVENINLLKDPKYLRPDPFVWWEEELCNPDAFVAPEVIVKTIKENFK